MSWEKKDTIIFIKVSLICAIFVSLIIAMGLVLRTQQPNYEHRDYLVIVRTQNFLLVVDETLSANNVISLSFLEENNIEYTLTPFEPLTIFVRRRNNIGGVFLDMVTTRKYDKIMTYILSFDIYENYLVIKPMSVNSFEFLTV
jgi:hypothetical protein